MITEDYVSFEIAKLLKEKGFDEFCYYYYMENGSLKLTNWNKEHNFCPCPTLQTTLKWLREKHNLYIVAQPNPSNPLFWINIYKLKNDEWVPVESPDTSMVHTPVETIFDKNFVTPEEACEAAIRYCLENLI